MKNLFLVLILSPFFLFSNDQQLPSKIKEVTVYLSGAQIVRSAQCELTSGMSEIVFTGLSPRIDENSIQISGLRSVSILSMAYDVNYLVKNENDPELLQWENEIMLIATKIAFLKNTILGLEEEAQVISSNRLVSSDALELNLERLKEVSIYYRKRTTDIKNEIFQTNLEINLLKAEIRQLQLQLAESNNTPEKEQGELKIIFDAPIASTLDLEISYTIQEAGWIPTYDLKSTALNAPLTMSYKANVYQKSGNDWKDVKVILSTGNPQINVAKPNLGTKYLNFVSRYSKRYSNAISKKKYVHNPTVKTVTGMVTDSNGAPLPGCNVMVKNTSNGTQTDFDGYFTLPIAQGQDLIFSYIGYSNIELPIYSSVMNVSLKEDAQALDEIVVTAYGAKRESNSLGYAISTIAADDLAGRAAGVRIAGSPSKVKPPELPLYVVDGIPTDDFVEGDLDENEIQSIEVLKAANAVSLYGSRGQNGVVVIATKKSRMQDDVTNTKFIIKKSYTILSDGDLTTIGINSFELAAKYEYYAAPIVNENVFLTASFGEWEQYNLLPGEANIYFAGSYAGKTTIDPYTVMAAMIVSLGIDPNITVTRKQDNNFKSKSFIGSNRILDRTYNIEVKNNKSVAVDLKLMDRIPISQNKDIRVDNVETYDAVYDKKKGLMTWQMKLRSQETTKKSFSFQVKYPKYKSISL